MMKRFALLLGCLCLFAFVTSSEASNPYYGHGHNYYGYNGYAYPYYNNYNYQNVDNVIVVGIPVQGLGLDFYYSVGDELREQRIA